jgi:hypothetical protein
MEAKGFFMVDEHNVARMASGKAGEDWRRFSRRMGGLRSSGRSMRDADARAGRSSLVIVKRTSSGAPASYGPARGERAST